MSRGNWKTIRWNLETIGPRKEQYRTYRSIGLDIGTVGLKWDSSEWKWGAEEKVRNIHCHAHWKYNTDASFSCSKRNASWTRVIFTDIKSNEFIGRSKHIATDVKFLKVGVWRCFVCTPRALIEWSEKSLGWCNDATKRYKWYLCKESWFHMCNAVNYKSSPSWAFTDINELYVHSFVITVFTSPFAFFDITA